METASINGMTERSPDTSCDSGKSADNIQDDSIDEELKIAAELKLCCTRWGIEKKLKLRRSASLISNLGKIYMNRAIHSRGMKQKICFIKSATLLVAAKVRFENLKLKQSANEVEIVYSDMCDHLLEICGARFTGDEVLPQLSYVITNRLTDMRQSLKVRYAQKLKAISDTLPEDVLCRERKQKSEIVQDFLKRNYDSYREIMKSIAEVCEDILPPPPCKYCIAGLGSAGRVEVTMHSDFEHVIILEDKCLSEDYDSIKEYFRWYAVVFQVLVIGIGETIIPSVGVDSINDLLSKDKSASWFFDSITPNGISFDGRFPHACKIPLALEPSEKRKQVLELIQPIENMVEFLSSDHDLGKAYHLKEMLRKTCFIAGDINVYGEYREKAWNKINDQGIAVAEEVLDFFSSSEDFILNKLESHDFTKNVFSNYDFMKIKDMLYRPISTLVSGLSLLFGFLEEGSNFAFFQWYRKNVLHAIPDFAGSIAAFLDSLEYSLAVACEIRMRMYAELSQQKGNSPYDVIKKLISKGCRRRVCRTIVLAWSVIRKIQLTAETTNTDLQAQLLTNFAYFGMDLTTEEPSLDDALALRFFGFTEDAFEIECYIYQNYPEDYKALGDFQYETWFAFYLYNSRNLDAGGKIRFAKMGDEIMSKVCLRNKNSKSVIAMATFHFRQKNSSAAFKLLSDWIDKIHSESGENQNNGEYIETLLAQYRLATDYEAPAVCVDYFKQQLAQSRDVSSQVVFNLGLYKAYISLGVASEAGESLARATDHYIDNVARIPFQVTLMIVDLLDRSDPASSKTGSDELRQKEKFRMMRQVTMEHMEYVVQNEFTWFMAMKNDTMFKGIPDVNHDPVELELRSSLVSNVLKTAYRIFKAYRLVFDQTPRAMLHSHLVYSALYNVLHILCEDVVTEPWYRFSDNFVTFWDIFQEHLLHPMFLYRLYDIAESIVGMRLSVISLTAQEEMPLDFTGARTFNRAASNVAALNLKRGASILWRIVCDCKFGAKTRNMSCKMLLNVINVSFFPPILQNLRNRDQRFISRHSFRDPDVDQSIYNKGVVSYLRWNLESAARKFWQATLQSKRGTCVKVRSIEMLLFVILTNSETSGSTLIIKERYVSLAGHKRITTHRMSYNAIWAHLHLTYGSFADIISNRLKETPTKMAVPTSCRLLDMEKMRILDSPEVCECLLMLIKNTYFVIKLRPFNEICVQLMQIFRIFSDQLVHPLLAVEFTSLEQEFENVFKEKVRNMFFDLIMKAYDSKPFPSINSPTFRKMVKPEQLGIGSIWKFMHHKKFMSTASEIMILSVNASLVLEKMKQLQENFIESHSLQSLGEESTFYNESLISFWKRNFEACAASLWRAILRAKKESKVLEKSTEMLFSLISCRWNSVGFPLVLYNGYINLVGYGKNWCKVQSSKMVASRYSTVQVRGTYSSGDPRQYPKMQPLDVIDILLDPDSVLLGLRKRFFRFCFENCFQDFFAISDVRSLLR